MTEEQRKKTKEFFALVVVVLPLMSGGAFFVHQSNATASDVGALKSDLREMSRSQNVLENRIGRLETRLDTIIDQNSQMLRVLTQR